jgi:hypothetical protein
MADSAAPSRRLSTLALQRKVEYMATLIYNALGPGSKEKVYQKALGKGARGAPLNPLLLIFFR